MSAFYSHPSTQNKYYDCEINFFKGGPVSAKTKLLIPFFTAGFPELDSIESILKDFDSAGADYIEIGLPHSDALADGPVIQESSHLALQNGINIALLFEQITALNGKLANAKLVLFSYFNPLLAFGLQRTVAGWKQAGGHALLVPDLPVEESEELLELCNTHGIKLIFLVAPTSTDERIKKIAELSQEFIYLVSVTGVTGVRGNLNTNLSQVISKIKTANTKVPVVVGFGISDAKAAQEAISQGADGVVVGSAIVKLHKQKDFAGANNLVRQIRTSLGFAQSEHLTES
jgi:tryptophan synthase alpha chain